MEKGIGDGREDDVPIPPGIGSPFEVVEAEFVLELLILLLDRPALMRDPDEPLQCRGTRQMNEEIFDDFGAANRPLEQQPHLGRQMGMDV